MAAIVLGVGASHTTLMNTHWHEVRHRDRAERFRDALAAARDALAAARPDAVVILGSNHFRGFYLDLIPAFTIGVGACIASGEAGTPSGPQPVDVALARHIAEHLIEHEIDVAFSAQLQVDHGITHALQYLTAGLEAPIVPIVVNVFAPPLPTLARCARFGEAVGAAIAAFPTARRVAVIASGGLSHRLPWPDWRSPQNDDEAFLVEAFLNGREQWKAYEGRRREIVLAAAARTTEPPINPAFDRAFLGAVTAGRIESVVAQSTGELQAQAGNGGQEIRTWIAMSRAVGTARGRVLAYEELPEWLTGMAVAVLDPLTAVP